jgi:hypothetical protein
MKYGWEASLDRWLTTEPSWRTDDDEDHEECADWCTICEEERTRDDDEEDEE